MGKVSPVVRQFLAVGCCNLLTLSFGCLSGWATINFVDLQSENTTSTAGILTLEEATLVVSILSLGGFVGNFAILPMSERFGIKRTIQLLGIPLILSSLLTIWAQNKYYLYISRILGGFVGGGLVVGIPTFVAEISHDKVRGTLNSLYDPSYNIGVLLSFFFGSYLDCIDQAKIQLIAPILFIIILLYLPESPEFHIKQNDGKRAIKSQKFFKGKHSIAEDVKFSSIPSDEVEKGKTEKVPEFEQNDKLTLEDFLTPQAKRAAFISFTSLFLSFICGVLVILSYVTAIFVETGSTLSAKASSFLISFTQLAANVIFLNIVDRFDRRTLFLWSSVLTGLAYFVFGVHCMLWTNIDSLKWMPPLCFSAIIFIGCLGILPIPFIITTEIFPQKIRGACLAISASMLWIVLLLLGSAYPIVQEAIGLPACMFTFGSISILSAAFGFWFIPETRGKSYDEIMELLSN